MRFTRIQLAFVCSQSNVRVFSFLFFFYHLWSQSKHNPPFLLEVNWSHEPVIYVYVRPLNFCNIPLHGYTWKTTLESQNSSIFQSVVVSIHISWIMIFRFVRDSRSNKKKAAGILYMSIPAHSELLFSNLSGSISDVLLLWVFGSRPRLFGSLRRMWPNCLCLCVRLRLRLELQTESFSCSTAIAWGLKTLTVCCVCVGFLVPCPL